jgi:hypothetical protein
MVYLCFLSFSHLTVIISLKSISLQEIEKFSHWALQFIGCTPAPYVGVPVFISRPGDHLSCLLVLSLKLGDGHFLPQNRMFKCKVKLSQQLNKQTLCHENILASGCVSPPFLTYGLDCGGQLHVPAALFWGKSPSVPIGQEAGWADAMEQTKVLSLPGIEPWPSSPSLYLLSYSIRMKLCFFSRDKLFSLSVEHTFCACLQ